MEQLLPLKLMEEHISFAKQKLSMILAVISVIVLSVMPVSADQGEDVAKKLANPVAALISVPVEFDTYSDIGPLDDGDRWTIKTKPVIPVTLNQEWNLISRTIVTYIDQEDIYPGAGSESGLGDILQSVFFSPKEPTARGWIWGAGPVLLIPTASDDQLGGEKWGTGPTGVVLKQAGPLTYGMLAHHVWSFAGDSDRSHISDTFLQPFVAYNTKTATTFSLNTESTYNWKIEEWSVPINAAVSQVLKIRDQLIQLKLGVRYWADSAPMDPEEWGVKLGIVFLFPK
jgi:hypothetical protein